MCFWHASKLANAIDEFLRHRRPDNAIVVRSSWRDNPWFTPELEEERQLDLKLYPERYDHIWEGDYAKAFKVLTSRSNWRRLKPRPDWSYWC